MSFQVLNMKMDVLFVKLAQNLSKNRIPKSRKKIVKKTKRQLLDYLTSGNRNYQTANNRTNFFYYSAVILDFLVERFFPVVDEYVGICDINLVVIVFDDFGRKKVSSNLVNQTLFYQIFFKQELMMRKMYSQKLDLTSPQTTGNLSDRSTFVVEKSPDIIA